jgi:hypothetical protein
MSEGEKTSSIRLPLAQEEYIKLMHEKYGFTRNNLIKMALLLHQSQFNSLLRNDINLHSEMISNGDKPKVAKCNHSARRNDSKASSPSRAPSIMSNHIDIYKIDINNSIVFSDKDLNDAWLNYLQFRKESRKTIRPSQMERIQVNIDKVLDAEGEAGLIRRLHTSVANGWQGFVFNNEELGKRTTNEHEEFTEDDL